eukprot:gnl/TRDRNA2_/TRDRNA2_151040_c1_seq1.p1 gnl/TRDRNA2_/TRDRNA2_151040_c1~~gnl/TRDRNA2_/TRDRNA2_151040_c1_seq1.p1  ORF type:complete len:340 (-),score=31.86 gnl/TRDRNA2_/TRDRNA2_151040_c1_seq1:4-987(-)
MLAFAVDERWEFVHVIGASMIINTVAGCIIIYAKQKKDGHSDRYTMQDIAYHAVTLGMYGFVKESLYFGEVGYSTTLLQVLRLFELIESLTSFVVGTCAVLVAGYMSDYRYWQLEGWKLNVRLLSIGTSIVTLSLGIYQFNKALLLKEMPHAEFTSRCMYLIHKIFLFAFQCSEVAALVSFVVFQLAVGTYGMLILFCLKCAFSFLFEYLSLRKEGAMAVKNGQRVPRAEIAKAMLSGVVAERLLLSKICKRGHPWLQPFLHVFFVILAWVVVAVHILTSQDFENSSLVLHLKTFPNLPIVALGAIGSVSYVICTVEQYFFGRWSNA